MNLSRARRMSGGSINCRGNCKDSLVRVIGCAAVGGTSVHLGAFVHLKHRGAKHVLRTLKAAGETLRPV